MIKPSEEFCEWPAAFLLWPEQERGKRRAQREGVKSREDHGDRDGQGKLLVEPSGDAWDKDGRHEDRRENQGDTDDRPGKLFHSSSSRVLGRQTLLNVALHAFDDDNGIVYHQADSEHQSEHRKRVDGEAEQRKENKRAHQRDGHGQHRNQRSPPVLQEEIDHQDDQDDSDQERDNDLLYAFRNCARLVKRYGVIHVLREALLHLGHQLSDASGGLDRIGTWQLVDRDNDGGLAIQATDNAVVLCAQLDAGNVFHANGTAIWRLAHDHVFELFRGRQAALRKHGISKLLVRESWLAAHLTSGIDRVLRLHRTDDVRDRDA